MAKRGTITAPKAETMPLPAKGKVKRYILTCAQNATKLHDGVWRNLEALAVWYDARIMVSRFHYETRFHGKTAKPTNLGGGKDDQSWFDPRIVRYVVDRRLVLAPGLEWCGELQILPTAKRPISGFESYTGRSSCVIPHPKYALQSIASGKHEATKLIYTTGCVTQLNYVQKKAGQLAQFHHGFGALLVEVDDRGCWYARQLNADSKGTINDLTLEVKNGRVTEGVRVEAIVWGDAHVRRRDKDVERLAWGDGGVVDQLRPKNQLFHDLLDFRARNHHEIGNGRQRFLRHVRGGAEDSVAEEVNEAAVALLQRSRPWCKSVVVASNHDAALQRWLDTADYRNDPKNALVFLRLQEWSYRQMQAGEQSPAVFERAMRDCVKFGNNVRFLEEDESYVVCPDANGGIECGMHGDLGPNGSRGSALALARMGRKAVVGHSHSAAIVDGVYVAGTSSELDMGYNRGPGSWTHSHVIVYRNGKRAIVTMWRGKWRA